jgi:hypothetical protein
MTSLSDKVQVVGDGAGGKSLENQEQIKFGTYIIPLISEFPMLPRPT